MKRLISVLLSASMVLALAGCGKKDDKETTKAKKTKVTEVTEETEEPSETETESETESETETETDPIIISGNGNRVATPRDYPLSDDFVISHDAEDLVVLPYPETQVYGEAVEKDSGTAVRYIFRSTDMLGFTEDFKKDYDQVYNTIQAQNDQLEINYNHTYSEQLSVFDDNLKSGDPKDYSMVTDITVFRADSEYISYILEQDYDCEMQNSSIKTYNYATADGREITFDEIVFDKRGFADFFLDYVYGSALYESEIEQAKEIAMDMVDESENASPIEFVLGYDGIYIFFSEPNLYPTMFKIPAVFAGDYMDVSYFGKTPKYYTLNADDYGRINWDLEDDGVIEEIYPEFETDEYDSVVGIDLVVDGQMRASVPDSDLVEGETYVGMKMMKTDLGFIVFLSMALEESVCTNYIFRYMGSVGFEFQGTISGNFTNNFYDPYNFELTAYDDVAGTGIRSQYYCFSDSSIPEPIEEYAYKDAFVVAAKDIACKAGMYDEDQGQKEDYTIPAGTVLYVFSYMPEGGYMRAMTVNKDDTKNVLVTIEFTREGYKTFINGEDQDEVFYGIRYAG